jgi:signal transduction histidine kinase
LTELLEDVLGLQDRALRSSHITVRKRFLYAAQVRGFPVELRQVFLNLIGNAIQAMPDGGTLDIHVHEATDWTLNRRGVMISIIDTGKGIQPEDAHRLFEPFYSTKSTKGTGLGLWISKGIAQKYDGNITCRSYRHAGGCVTCFRVFLPGSGTTMAAAGAGGDSVMADYKASANGHDGSMLHPIEGGVTYDMSANG